MTDKQKPPVLRGGFTFHSDGVILVVRTTRKVSIAIDSYSVHINSFLYAANNVWALGCRFLKLNDRYRVDPPYRALQLNRFLAVNSLDIRYKHLF